MGRRRGTGYRPPDRAVVYKPPPEGVIMQTTDYEWVWYEGRMNANSSGIYNGCLERRRKGSTARA